jgi:hypothetical protein
LDKHLRAPKPGFHLSLDRQQFLSLKKKKKTTKTTTTTAAAACLEFSTIFFSSGEWNPSVLRPCRILVYKSQLVIAFA